MEASAPPSPSTMPIAIAPTVTPNVVSAGTRKTLEKSVAAKTWKSKCTGDSATRSGRLFSLNLADVALREVPLGEDPVVAAVVLDALQCLRERVGHFGVALLHDHPVLVARLARRAGQDRARQLELRHRLGQVIGERPVHEGHFRDTLAQLLHGLVEVRVAQHGDLAGF